MTDRTTRPTPTFHFETDTDGCDAVLAVYRHGRKRPLARLGYWTAAGLADPLAALLARTPGLPAAARQFLAEMQAELTSDDPMTRYLVERQADLFVAVWAAIARTERDGA